MLQKIGKKVDVNFSENVLSEINLPLIKNPQFYSYLAEILAKLPTHGLIILTKFDWD